MSLSPQRPLPTLTGSSQAPVPVRLPSGLPVSLEGDHVLEVLDAELRDFVTEGPEALHQFDANGTILWANQAELDLLGYTHDEFVGHRIHEFHEDQDLMEAFLFRLASGATVRNMKSRMRARDGTWKDVLIHSNVLVDPEGRFVRSRCFVRDVSDIVRLERERRAATELLRQRERQQAALARLGRDALHHADLDPLLESVVQDLAVTLGVEVTAFLEVVDDGHLRFRAGAGWASGVSGQEGLVPTPPGSHARVVLDAAGPVAYPREGGAFTPAPVLRQHGCVAGLSTPVRSRSRLFGILGAHSRRPRQFTPEDETFLEAVAHMLAGALELRAAEQELQRSRDELENLVAHRTRQLATSNRELEAFSYSVSHDLREPLRAIHGYSSLLARRVGAVAPDCIQLLDGVRTSAVRLGKLIDDLLDLSRVQRVEFQRKRVDLSLMAEQAMAQHAAAEQGRKVEWAVDPGIVVQGDPVLLATLLDNLLNNAWKFTRRTPDARIELRSLGQGQDVLLCVRDNGAGFSMDLAGKLFKPFERLHLASDFEGTGVGLATVHRIVERHGGHIWAEGKPGEGATFYFTLGQGGKTTPAAPAA
ncbi:MAG TPA: ATP-binding protein [Candidatus Thermoplasmatota archaeon]|nr:ATP-binding protein [Candidatus Thermoplasmatota archaeon]